MTSTCRVSIIIPTYQRSALLKRTLQFLERQTIPAEDFEVVVSIDGSVDGTEDMLRQLHLPYRLVWHRQDNRGRAAACNAGLQTAGGELIVLLDDDMEPIPTFLEAHARAHHGNDRLGVLGAVPIAIEPDASPVTRYVGTKFNAHLDNLAQPGYRLKLRDFYSGNFSVQRPVLAEAGGFDEDFSLYGNEDLELSLRLRQAGVHFVYAPDAVAHQRYTKDFAALAQDTMAKGRTAVLLAGKHPGTVEDLKLGTFRHASAPVRLLRDGLLGLSERWPILPPAVIRCVMWMERIPAFSPHAVYRHVLGYFYWLGARAALRESEASGAGITSRKTDSREVKE